MTRRDVVYAARAKRHGAKHTIKTVQEARKAGVPLSWAFALVEQETDFKNIFGHDGGSILHGLPVTQHRVTMLLNWVAQGGNSNGVGLTQLTWPPLIKAANRRGGAHKPRVQLRLGFEFFHEVTGGDYGELAWRFNGSPRYQPQIEAKQRRWHSRLTRGKA